MLQPGAAEGAVAMYGRLDERLDTLQARTASSRGGAEAQTNQSDR
jgi:hypothetical protein